VVVLCWRLFRRSLFVVWLFGGCLLCGRFLVSVIVRRRCLLDGSFFVVRLRLVGGRFLVTRLLRRCLLGRGLVDMGLLGRLGLLIGAGHVGGSRGRVTVGGFGGGLATLGGLGGRG